MSILDADSQNIFRTGTDLAKALPLKSPGVRARQLDRIFNGTIVPTLGLHGTLIGACILLFDLQANVVLANIFLLISFASLALYQQSKQQDDVSSTGFVGAFCAFATGSVVAFNLGTAEIIAANIAAYGIVANAAIRNPACARELAFTPIYTALLLLISNHHRIDAAIIYLPAFVIGIGTLIILRKLVLSYGIFCGMILVLLTKLIQSPANFTFFAFVSAANIVVLGIYTAAAAEPNNSNLRNLLSQSIAVALILTIVSILTVDPRPFWLWPVGVAAFYTVVFGLTTKRLPSTATTLIVVSIIGAVWLTGNLGFGPEWDNRLRILISSALPISVYFVGRRDQNRFVCNLGRLLLLVSGLVCLNFANQQRIIFSDYKRPVGASIMDTLLDVIAWHEYALTTAFFFCLLTVTLMTAGYLDPDIRHPTPWWRGLTKPRHAVVLRALYRTCANWLENIPVLGGVLKLIKNGVKGLRYLTTTEEPLAFTDGAIIAILVIFALSFTHLMGIALNPFDLTNGPANTSAGPLWISQTASWTLCAVLSYCIGLYQRQTLFLFSAVAFALVPIAGLFENSTTLQKGVVILTVSITLVLCKLLRGYTNFNR